MQHLTPGANAALTGTAFSIAIRHGAIAGADLDVSAFLVTASGKVRGDADMVFYGQAEGAGGAVRLISSAGGETRFSVDAGALPAEIEKVVFTATIHENKATFDALPPITVELGSGQPAAVLPCAGRTETALILAEIYRRGGTWKLRAVGQGFNGGLAALAPHFGVVVEESAPAPAATPKVNLEKRLVDLAKRDPELVSLVKKVQVSLEKKGITRDRAKVCLCLDISGSMDRLYRSGKIDVLVSRVMALGYRFDDDGEIDVFLFGQNVHEFGTVGVDGYRALVRDISRQYRLEGGTRYGKAIQAIRAFYAKGNAEGLPVYVMFVTDGATEDKPLTERELRAASAEPIFWKFMGLIEKGFFSAQRLEFLEKLDDLTGRTVDNADFFQLADPAAPSDEEMFDLMMTEYQDWIAAATAAGILR
ncbi:VWA domain-containing protein [Defluviimonas salinarum]|uniref:VWA domain-containing protein n=1 Tax=Defluviimonas salinarum TaxID=2992147 RepID=A0ABT3J4E0_9RHOB|nr:VWA domain-containing protein [Defluviimonas salinarum]MCW3782536.1 VWA domain-containing protein [Defluviimonas salinarum]